MQQETVPVAVVPLASYPMTTVVESQTVVHKEQAMMDRAFNPVTTPQVSTVQQTLLTMQQQSQTLL